MGYPLCPWLWIIRPSLVGRDRSTETCYGFVVLALENSAYGDGHVVAVEGEGGE